MTAGSGDGIDPDVVPVGFAATEGDGAVLRRHRNPLLLVIAIVLVVGGLVGVVGFIVVTVASGTNVDGRAVAEGRVAALDGPDTAAVSFVAPEAGRYTVWLRTDGITETNNRETVVAATNCVASFADGSTSTFRGAIQRASVTVGDRSTVGMFTAPEGTVEVDCRMERFGRYTRFERLRRERDFVVVPGSAGSGLVSWVGLFVGIGAIVGGVAVGLRWWNGSVRRRSRPGSA